MANISLPPYYQKLYDENPAAYLVELVLAEMLLVPYVNKPVDEVDFNALSSAKQGITTEHQQQLSMLLQFLYQEFQRTPPKEPLPLSQHGKELLTKMQQAHTQFTDPQHGNNIYQALYAKSLPALVELRKRSNKFKEMTEVEAMFHTAMMAIIMEMSGQTLSSATIEAAEGFSTILNVLGELMYKKRTGVTEV